MNDPQAGITIWQVLGYGIPLICSFIGALYGILKYSVGRNVLAMDQKFTSLQIQVSAVEAKVDELKHSYGREGMTRTECSVCRKECGDRLVRYQHDIVEWMRRQEDKSDKIIMMIANLNNGQGGVENGYKK
jgi:formate dehydrogenase assembly factor FdhD